MKSTERNFHKTIIPLKEKYSGCWDTGAYPQHNHYIFLSITKSNVINLCVI